MTRASEDVLASLHDALATQLIAAVQSGEAQASILNVARQFLKDNGIDCVATESNPLGQLAQALPTFADDSLTH